MITFLFVFSAFYATRLFSLLPSGETKPGLESLLAKCLLDVERKGKAGEKGRDSSIASAQPSIERLQYNPMASGHSLLCSGGKLVTYQA